MENDNSADTTLDDFTVNNIPAKKKSKKVKFRKPRHSRTSVSSIDFGEYISDTTKCVSDTTNSKFDNLNDVELGYFGNGVGITDDEIELTDVNDSMEIVYSKKKKIKSKNKKIKPSKSISKRNIEAAIDELNKISPDNMPNQQSNGDFVVKVFDDYRPKDKTYFSKSENHGGDPNGLGVVIPFFNESNDAVQQTLNSLHNAWNYLRLGSRKWREKNLKVCLIQDGWYKSDDSMKEYLKALFPAKINDDGVEKYWWEHDDFNQAPENQASVPNKTYIFEKKNYGAVKINPQEKLKDDNKFLSITLVIKLQNQRKHNSQEWFCGKNGFADSTNPEYLFFTDAFAMYQNWCLYHLCKELDKNKKMVAVTGRQRLMSKRQQGSSESFFSLETMLRHVQLYDFESSNVIYNGAFSLGGMLPVIPGPCGLYRASNLLDDNVRDYYFETVNKDPSKTGIIGGNLQIAEDRILTYASVVKSNIKGAYMKFNTSAIFYFEAEIDLDSFLFQRRRWINGSVAGYIYLLFLNFQLFRQWKANIFKKIYIWLLLMCQFLTYIMVGFAPGVTMRMLYFGINYFLDYYDVDLNLNLILSIDLSIPVVIFAIIIWVIYLYHLYTHHERSKYNYLVIYALLGLSILTSLFSIASLIHYAFVEEELDFSDIFLSENVIVYLAIYVTIGPFIVSLLLSGAGHSFLFMIKSIIYYFLFLPMLIAWFGSYSYARLWDLSWGNRPASEMDSVAGSQKDKTMRKFKNLNKKIIGILILLNLGIFLIPVEGQLIIMCIFFVLAAYQLTLSIVYCLIQYVCSKIPFAFKKIRKCCYCCKKKDEFSIV